MLTAADLYATLTSPLSPIYAQTTEERDLATEIQLVNHWSRNICNETSNN